MHQLKYIVFEQILTLNIFLPSIKNIIYRPYFITILVFRGVETLDCDLDKFCKDFLCNYILFSIRISCQQILRHYNYIFTLNKFRCQISNF